MSILNADLLSKAAQIVEERGLAQGAYLDGSGAVCILGAVAIARGYDLLGEYAVESGDLDRFVEEPFSELAVLIGRDPVAFSDDDGRTAHEVAEALRDAAKVRLDEP